jgi:tetratricopeptide (TPR) repeat protein
MPKPLCFVIMPYGRKPTQAEAGRGPAEIDFNGLWDRAYVPVIEALGYEAVRADQDTGAMIVTQMLERIYFADLVLADMTIANGNVYYEVGIRHASQAQGCVLLAADWSRQLFDLAQMRTVRYPLAEGDITALTAQSIRAASEAPIAALAEGRSPMHEAIDGFPLNVNPGAASTMKQRMADLAAFQSAVRAVRLFPRAQRMEHAQALIKIHGVPPIMAPVALALLLLLRDSAEAGDDWRKLLAFIDSLPEHFRQQEAVREQRAFALSQTGAHVEAIAELEALLETCGPSVERLGLLGGRYKRLLADATATEDRQRYLECAIAHYERGMELDLNEYYCSSNLPRLYRQRGRKGDMERAASVLQLVIAACERAKKRGVPDEWWRPALLGAAFDEGNADRAEELAGEVMAEGVTRWKIASVLDDLEASVKQTADKACRSRLSAVIDMLAPERSGQGST